MSRILLALLLGLLPGLVFAEELIHTTATLSEARSYLGATSVGNLAFFAGGRGDSGLSDAVDVYDAASETWSTAALSQPRYDLAATSVGNLAFFAGGQIGTATFSNVVDIFDADTETWSTATLLQPRARLAGIGVGNLAIFAGGYDENGSSAVFDIFNGDTGIWFTAVLPAPLHWPASATVGGKVLFAYGEEVAVFNSTTSTWSSEPLPGGSAAMCGATVGSKALLGGFLGMYVYDEISGNWTTRAREDYRWGYNATALGDKALFGGGRLPSGCHGIDLDGDGVIGGTDLDIIRAHWGEGDKNAPNGSPPISGDSSGDGFVGGDDLDLIRAYWGQKDCWEDSYHDILDIYDDTTGLWSVDTLSVARCALAATTAGNRAIFAGGHGDDGHTSVVDIYTLPTDVQQIVPEPATLDLLAIGALMILGLRRRNGD